MSATGRRLIKASGLPRIRPLQDFRYTYATVVLVRGRALTAVQERPVTPPIVHIKR